MENRSSNKTIIILLSVLIIIAAGVGGYFIIKDAMNSNVADTSGGDNGNQDNGKTTPSDQPSSGSEDDKGNKGDGQQPASGDSDDDKSSTIEAGITYAEVRNQNFYVEVQTNGAITGSCEISIMPTSGGQGSTHTADLEPQNKVSLCSTNFSVKGLNPGDHNLTVTIKSTDGRSVTLEQLVKV